MRGTATERKWGTERRSADGERQSEGEKKRQKWENENCLGIAVAAQTTEGAEFVEFFRRRSSERKKKNKEGIPACFTTWIRSKH